MMVQPLEKVGTENNVIQKEHDDGDKIKDKSINGHDSFLADLEQLGITKEMLPETAGLGWTGSTKAWSRNSFARSRSAIATPVITEPWLSRRWSVTRTIGLPSESSRCQESSRSEVSADFEIAARIPINASTTVLPVR